MRKLVRNQYCAHLIFNLILQILEKLLKIASMKRMIIFIGLVSIIIEISAQVSNYDKTKTFHEESYTYQCDVID